ncbi:hypothetical protein H2248_003283 [Termitomyces sp. 'cryptogamus']|nr:hypothetical protein H2248_003283 [Termitomyces sp. 'cryptogamus']
MPSAMAAIEHVSKDDCKAHIIQKFKDLAKEVRHVQGKKAILLDVGAQDAAIAGSEGQKGKGNSTVKKENFTEAKKSVCQSQQQGKLKMHIKKYAQLLFDSKWKDLEYDAAMTSTLMSDDEDFYDDGGKLALG